MSLSQTRQHTAFDKVLRDIADYVCNYRITTTGGTPVWEAAHYCLIDSLGCAFEARAYPGCNQLIGPIVSGTVVPFGARVPATSWQLDPVEAAFSTSTLIRWLDFNDAFYGETVIHPSDCIGALLAVADWQSRRRVSQGKAPLLVRDVLDAMIRAYEIMGCLALANGFTTRMGIDHVILIKIGAAALATKLLGGTRDDILNAVSNAWIDGQPLALFRRGPDAGARKSWAAGDAAARGVWLALMAMRGEMGYPSALTAKTWGFYDVMNQGEPFMFQRPYENHVIENVQYKISYPAGIHAQSAAEAAIALHSATAHRIDKIRQIEIRTHQYAHGILNRTGALKHVAERDHSLQYIAAICLIFGRLEAADYEDAIAADPRIDALRAKIVLTEHAPYTQAFYDPSKRANPNAIRVTFNDGTQTAWMAVEYPIGHPRRRKQGIPLLKKKFESGVARVFNDKRRLEIVALCNDRARCAAMPVNTFLDLFSA
ncbi:MAG: bifunctional 2-methylcitrate dehydratase/aconitate hydratase [Burkholderiales bacterium]